MQELSDVRSVATLSQLIRILNSFHDECISRDLRSDLLHYPTTHLDTHCFLANSCMQKLLNPSVCFQGLAFLAPFACWSSGSRHFCPASMWSACPVCRAASSSTGTTAPSVERSCRRTSRQLFLMQSSTFKIFHLVIPWASLSFIKHSHKFRKTLKLIDGTLNTCMAFSGENWVFTPYCTIHITSM